MILKPMRQLILLIAVSVVYLSPVYSQTVVVESLIWGDQPPGATTGTSTEGAVWDGILADDIGNDGFFGATATGFLFDDVEGFGSCPCADGSNDCGDSSNALEIIGLAVQDVCEATISFDVRVIGNALCGAANDQSPNDVDVVFACGSDLGAEWTGTDALNIEIFYDDTGERRVIDICGAFSSTGSLTVSETFDVSVSNSAISVFITGGTQNDGVSYEVGDITITGQARLNTDITPVVASPSGVMNNEVCTGAGTIVIQTPANPNSDFTWTLPDGTVLTGDINNGRHQLILNNIDPSMTGTYGLLVVDQNGCQLFETFELTVLPMSDQACQGQVDFFSQAISAVECSDRILPSTDDNGVTGTWTPGDVLADFAGERLTFTFTPDDGTIAPFVMDIRIDDLSQFQNFATVPDEIPMLCNAGGETYDFIELFQLNHEDYTLTIQGDVNIFDFIDATSGNVVNDFIDEFRAIDVTGLSPRVAGFQIDAQTDCGADPLTKTLLVEIVAPPTPVIMTPDLCAGESFDFRGLSLERDTTITDGGACDSVFIVDFNELSSVTSRTLFPGRSAACGEVFYYYSGDDVNGNNIGWVKGGVGEPAPFGPDFDTLFTESATGFYTLPIPASNGCDSIQRIQVDIGVTTVVENTFDLCENRDTTIMIGSAVYVINAANPSEVIPTGGCSFLDITANILPAEPDRDIQEVHCAGDVVQVEISPGNFMDFDDSMTYPVTLDVPTSSGCDAIVNVDLTFNPLPTSILERRLCPGEELTIGTEVISGPVTDQEVILSGAASTGCDSIVVVTTTVIEPMRIPRSETLCPEETFELHGVMFDINNPSGPAAIQSLLGCDSIIFDVTLDFFDAQDTMISPMICLREEIFLPEYNFTIDRDNLTADFVSTTDDGCMQNVLIRASLTDAVRDTFPAQICNSEFFPFAGRDLDISGFYSDTLVSVTGCDSISTLDLTVIPSIPATDDGRFEACTGVLLSYLGVDYPLAGRYRDTLTSAQGCDSIVTFIISYRPVLEEDIGLQLVCPGDEFPFLGDTYGPGEHNIMLQTQEGCDSTVTFEVGFFNTPSSDLGTLMTCPAVPLEVNGQLFDTPGPHMMTLPSSQGCDSTVTFFLEFDDIPMVDDGTMFTCPDQPIDLFGNTYDTEGTFQETLQTPEGCDSIVQFTVEFFDTPTTDLGQLVTCPSVPVRVNDQDFGTEGEHMVVLASADGCDSTVVFEVVFERRPATDVIETVCAGESFTVFGQSFFASTDQMLTSPGGAFDGCDSTVRLQLTVLEELEEFQTFPLCEGSNIMVLGRQFNQAVSDEPIILQSSAGCDSTIFVTIVVNENQTTDLGTMTVCPGETVTIAGQDLVEGPNTLDFQTSEGCDSTVTVVLETLDEIVNNIEETICIGESIDFQGQMISAPGEYSETLISSAGCDSLVILTLANFAEIAPTNLPEETICAGESFAFQGEDLTESGEYPFSLQGANGCDSMVILTLTVREEIITEEVQEICDNESFVFNGQTFTDPGTFDLAFTSQATGCDSTVRLTLIVNETYLNDIGNREICPGGSVTVAGETFTTEGPHMVPLLSSAGCDSIVTFTLEIVESINVDLGSMVICDGESFDFNGQIITTSGIFEHTTQTALGCDSITTIQVDVTPEMVITTSQIIGSCEGGANGSFVIDGLPDATPPFSVSGLSGITSISSLPFTVTGLSAGTFNFELTDQNGCSALGQAEITNDRTFALNITSVTIDPAGMFELMIDYDGVIVRVEWEDVEGLSCLDCINPMVDIVETTTFTVRVYDEEGCVSEDEITLEVNGIGNIYFANVINPNSALGNHRFFPQAENPAGLMYDLDIYDRWGNQVYEMREAPVNDQNFGWNGRYRDNRINAGVYVFSARVTSDIGLVKTYKGDITVLE